MAEQIVITLTQQHDYQFLIDFGEPVPTLLTDESAPLGQDAGPDPTRLLATAVANCLAASLLFALRKFKNQPEPIQAKATVTMTRNLTNRLRIGDIAVELQIGQQAVDVAQLDRILGQFEDFCVVTQSVRQGLPVSVKVLDSAGQILHNAD
ncbi:OsmC family protein [Chitinivorax sp. B]|uniref:OsmC family protein n=1 Tax=Chitinivorax sp. B TaxID=2502235 RepID=UPI0032D5A614